VRLTPDGGTPEVVPQVPTVGDCGTEGGWYYDNPAAPTKILLCPASCELVQSVNQGAIEIVLGCQTIVK
jgi:hypothetical protein